MKPNFDIDKFLIYLNKYKSDLPNLYKWNAKIDRLLELKILTSSQINEILNLKTPFDKELQLRKILNEKLTETFEKNNELFNILCLWIIKDWGGITNANDNETITLIKDFLEQDKPKFNRIASTSKVGAFLYPDQNVIYDSRVAYSINWIILSENAGNFYFPIPEGRNSKMSALDLNVLIRLENISVYCPNNIEQLDNKLFISNSDKKVYIDKKSAYFEMNKLIKEINQQLWKGDTEREKKLYFTEMLLFSIADREVFMDITTRYSVNQHNDN